MIEDGKDWSLFFLPKNLIVNVTKILAFYESFHKMSLMTLS